MYILGDLNINLINNQKRTPNGIKRYQECCLLHGLKQLITSPTRVTENSSSLLSQILKNSTDRVSQSGMVDTGLSDHQLMYCTRKVNRTKFNTHKYIRTRLLKHYSQSLSPCIMCVCSTVGVLSTVGVFSTVGDIMSTVGDILSTVGVFSTVGGYLEYRGDVQYRGGIS